MDLFSSNGECAIPGGLLPSPSSNLFERSMGALVSTLKNNIYTTIPNQNQSYSIVVQQPMPNNTNAQSTTQMAQQPNTQNVAVTNQYNTNVITVPPKDQQSTQINNNTSTFYQNNVVISSIQNQQPQSVPHNINTTFYNASNVNQTPTSQNIIQQNLSYTVNPQNPTSNTNTLTINGNNVQNQQLNAINTIQQQSFKPALDYIVGSFMDSIDSMNEKLDSKNIFSLDQNIKPVSNDASKDSSKIDYNSNMLLLFPPNQETPTVTVNQLQQLQKTQDKTTYPLQLQTTVQTTVQSTVVTNQQAPAPHTIIMGPPPVPKKKHQKQLDNSNNNNNNNNNNNDNKQDQLTPQLENEVITPSTMNTQPTIQPSPVLSTDEHISSVLPANKPQPSPLSNANQIYPSPMMQTINITPSPVMRTEQLQTSPMIQNGIVQIPQSNTQQSVIIQSQPYSQNISQTSYSQNISNTSQIINNSAQPIIVNNQQQISNTPTNQIFQNNNPVTFNQQHIQQVQQVQQVQQIQQVQPQIHQQQVHQQQVHQQQVHQQQVHQQQVHQVQVQQVQPQNQTVFNLYPAQNQPIQSSQPTIINIKTVQNNGNNGVISASSNTYPTPQAQSTNIHMNTISNTSTIVQQQPGQLHPQQTQFIVNNGQQIISQNQMVNAQTSIITQNQNINNQPQIISQNQTINLNQPFISQVASQTQPKQQFIQQNQMVQPVNPSATSNVIPQQTVQAQPYYSVVNTNYSQQKSNVPKQQEVKYYISPVQSQSVILSTNESNNTSNMNIKNGNNEILSPESLSSSSISNQNPSSQSISFTAVYPSSSSLITNSSQAASFTTNTQISGQVPAQQATTLTTYYANTSSMNNNTIVLPSNLNTNTTNTTNNNNINSNTALTNNLKTSTLASSAMAKINVDNQSSTKGKIPIKAKTNRAKSITDKRKPFHCDLCPQTFSRSHDLKRHRYIHTGIKPFKCEKCGKSFSRRDALNRHARGEINCLRYLSKTKNNLNKSFMIKSTTFLNMANPSMNNTNINNSINTNVNTNVNNNINNTNGSNTGVNTNANTNTNINTNINPIILPKSN